MVVDDFGSSHPKTWVGIFCHFISFCSGTPWAKLLVGYTVGWFCGAKFHTGKQKKKMNAKHKAEQKQLYTQYYNDVYSLREENAQLKKALEQLGYTVR